MSMLIYSLNISYLLIFLTYRIFIIVKSMLVIDYIIPSAYGISLEVVDRIIPYDNSRKAVGW